MGVRALGLVEVFALPTHLRVASERMAEVIRGSKFDALFLNLSRRLNVLVRALAEGVPYEEFIEMVRERALIPEPLSSWEYWVKPILLAVRGILNEKPELRYGVINGLTSFSSQLRWRKTSLDSS